MCVYIWEDVSQRAAFETARGVCFVERPHSWWAGAGCVFARLLVTTPPAAASHMPGACPVVQTPPGTLHNCVVGCFLSWVATRPGFVSLPARDRGVCLGAVFEGRPCVHTYSVFWSLGLATQGSCCPWLCFLSRPPCFGGCGGGHRFGGCWGQLQPSCTTGCHSLLHRWGRKQGAGGRKQGMHEGGGGHIHQAVHVWPP